VLAVFAVVVVVWWEVQYINFEVCWEAFLHIYPKLDHGSMVVPEQFEQITENEFLR